MKSLIKATSILQKHYKSVLGGRKITPLEVVAEAKNALRKWDDNIFLENMRWVHGMDKADWEQVAQVKF